MALLFCEHFDGYDTTAKYRAAGGYISGGGTYEPAAGRFGGRCGTRCGALDRAYPAPEAGTGRGEHLADGLSHPLPADRLLGHRHEAHPAASEWNTRSLLQPLGL